MRPLHVELHFAAQEIVGGNVTEHQVGVGHRRLVALAIGRRPRIGPGALRANPQEAEGIDAGQRTAAGAAAGNVDHLDGDAMLADPRFGGGRDLAVLDDADVEAGAAHVDGQQIVLAVQTAEIGGGGRRRGRTGIEQVDGPVDAFVDDLDEAIGQHHQQAAAKPMVLQAAFQPADIAGHRRTDISADHRGAEPLELAPDRQDFV